MGKPRLIILIRHAQSEGNKNREIHQAVPDHRVKLTPEGKKQALEAGRKLRTLLRPDDTLHFFTSPYRRTRETTAGILESLTSDEPSPSPFPRHTIKVYEEPRLREQDFGNFQPCGDEMERMWQERADYGHFFYRIPNGESAADAYDRVSGFNESLWRLFGEDDFASVCILVTHGLMTRVFLMKWYHFSVEYFEDLRNVNHCEFVVMKKNPDNGKFVLQNQLRTWSQLQRDRERERERSGKPTPALDWPIPPRRKWGGCPDGCDHAMSTYVKKHPRRQNTADLFHDSDEEKEKKEDRNGKAGQTSAAVDGDSTEVPGSQAPFQANVTVGPAATGSEAVDTSTLNDTGLSPVSVHANRRSKASTSDFASASEDDTGYGRKSTRSIRPRIYHNTSVDTDADSTTGRGDHGIEQLTSRGLALLQLGGRDGGGSMSGTTSLVGSDDDEREQTDEGHSSSRPRAPQPKRVQNQHHRDHRDHRERREHQARLLRPDRSQSRVHLPVMANTLGDGDDDGSDGAAVEHGRLRSRDRNRDRTRETSETTLSPSLEEQKREDQSLRGSVY